MFSPTNLSVTVQRARNLVLKGKNNNDAFATMEFNGEKYATRVDETTLNPTWHQECKFQLPPGGVLDKQVVTVTIYHKNSGKLGLHNNDFLGQVQVPLSCLHSTDSRERNRWYKLIHRNPKKEKKDRGEVEIGFKFLQISRDISLPDKKSPTTLRNLKSNLKNKLRRRSEDEDSGVGSEGHGMSTVQSMENLRKVAANDSMFEKVEKPRSLSTVEQSARGSVKGSSLPGSLRNKAMSMEVLHKSEYSTSMDNVATVHRSNSGGKQPRRLLHVGKGHHRNKSMPNAALLLSKGKTSSTNDLPTICVNGNHVYVSGATADSGNSSLTASPELVQRSSSLGKNETNDKPHVSVQPIMRQKNRNFSNSKRHSIADIQLTRPSPIQPLTAVYKPKNYYRLDVKELGKNVSTIHENPSISFNTLSREELLALCTSQHQTITEKNAHIRELEDYIDCLLVKVMVCTPALLDSAMTKLNNNT